MMSDDKTKQLDDAVVVKNKTKRAKSAKPSKKELETEVEQLRNQLEQQNSEMFKPEQLAMIHQGLFTTMEGFTGLLFTQAEKVNMDNLNDAGTLLANKYASSFGKYAVEINYGLMFGVLFIDAYSKTKKDLKSKNKIKKPPTKQLIKNEVTQDAKNKVN